MRIQVRVLISENFLYKINLERIIDIYKYLEFKKRILKKNYQKKKFHFII